MSKPNQNKDSGWLGNLYDLDGDGHTDAAETALMFMIFDEMQKEAEQQKQAQQSKTYDLDEWDLNPNEVDMDSLDIKGI